MRPTFDLQSHSTCSDGALPPAEVVSHAARAGVELLALSDHDTVDGVREAREAARSHGLRLTSAVEISSVDGVFEDIHVCGYDIDVESPDLTAALHDYREDRVSRTEAIVDRLRELGFELDETALKARRASGRPLGRPHIVDAVLQHPANAERLEAEGVKGPNEFFPLYVVPGAPAFVSRSHPTVPDAIDLIHAAGGVAVWAHPFWDLDDPEETLETLDRFGDAGCDGVEAFYATHTREQTEILHRAASARGMLITGSSDFHGPEHDRFSRFLGFELHGLEPNLGPIGAGA